MSAILRKADRILFLWRRFGPCTERIDLDTAFKEIVLPMSGGDSCEIVHESFDSFEGIMIRKGSERSWLIGVNSNIDYQPRRNFTLAHEIGHFVAHRDLRERFECTFENLNDFDVQPLEIEANDFASHLLMPPDVVREFDRERPFVHESIVELSNRLGTSMEAAAFRWINLSNKSIAFIKSRDGFIDKARASEKLYKAGVWFKQGTELPENALAKTLNFPGDSQRAQLDPGIWSLLSPCRESSYAAKRQGYVYTYLEFDER